MKLTRRVITAGALACALSGACTLMLSWRLARASASERERMTAYAAPVRDVPAGKALEAADLHLLPWPADRPVEGALVRVDDALGRTSLYPLAPGQPLLERDLSAHGSGPGLAGKIPDGMRALALRSDEVVGVGGFLSPGLHVDMLVTFHADGAEEPQTIAALQNAEVIAVGQQSEPDPQGKPATATVVTLLLTPEQAQRALLASTQGTVHFVLRNSSDQGSSRADAVRLSELGATLRRPAMPATSAMPLVQMAAQPEKRPSRTPLGAHPVAAESSAVETILNDRGKSAGAVERKTQ